MSSTPKAVIHDNQTANANFVASTEIELDAALSHEMKAQQDSAMVTTAEATAHPEA